MRTELEQQTVIEQQAGQMLQLLQEQKGFYSFYQGLVGSLIEIESVCQDPYAAELLRGLIEMTPAKASEELHVLRMLARTTEEFTKGTSVYEVNDLARLVRRWRMLDTSAFKTH